LDNLYYYNNFIPDVIVIDYADILAPSRGVKGEHRHIIDDIWKKLRRLAQERSALVVTASQAGRASLNRDVSEEHIAEDIRKLAHVAKMMSINKSKEDDKINAVRIEQLAERDGNRNPRKALVLQCLEIGRSYIDSRYADEILIEEEEE
jgi:replicative DNA helicase